MRKLLSPTGKPIVCVPIWPNVGVEAWYYSVLNAMIDQSSAELIKDITTAWNKAPPILGTHITTNYGDSAFFGDATAAGVLFRSRGNVLMVKRTDGEGWAFPGGTVEPDETPEAAARREAFEELLYAFNGLLEPFYLQRFKRTLFATYLADVIEEFIPRLNREHDEFRWLPPREALTQLRLHPGARRALRELLHYELITHDAPSPTKALQSALAKWGTQAIKKFDAAAERIANDFATRSQRATQAAMMSQLKRAGFIVAFKPTRKSIEAFRAVVAENIGLIRSIPRKFHAQVEQKVWNAVRGGSDLHKLSTELVKAHGITTRRAALISRDQNAKAKAVIERVRQQEVGIHRGIWMHSNAGKEPRPVHVKWGKEQKVYNLAKGLFDPDEEEWVHPGQLISCRCSMRPIIEGFVDD